MAWIYSPELAVSQLHSANGSGQSPIVKTTDTLKLCCLVECTAEISRLRRFAQIFENSAATILRETWTYYTADFHVKISANAEMVTAWTASEVDFFSRSCAWPKKSSPTSYFLKMLGTLEQKGLKKSRTTFPTAGMIVDGIFCPLTPTPKVSKASGGFAWPRPKASEAKQAGLKSESDRHQPNFNSTFRIRFGRQMPIEFMELAMGYKLGHMQLEPWAMQWYRIKRKPRSKG